MSTAAFDAAIKSGRIPWRAAECQEQTAKERKVAEERSDATRPGDYKPGPYKFRTMFAFYAPWWTIKDQKRSRRMAKTIREDDREGPRRPRKKCPKVYSPGELARMPMWQRRMVRAQ